MNAPKVGDRVRVQLEGEVTARPNCYGMLRVDLDGGRYSWAGPEHCTVIAPPVEVGDLIDYKNVHACPNETIAARPGGSPLTYRRGAWWRESVVTDGFAIGAVILRVGDGVS